MAKASPPDDPLRGDYAVGYGRPPEATRFRKGRSGNPNGRPRRETTVAGAMQKELARTVTVREGGRARRCTMAEATAKQVVLQAAKGDARALAQVLKAEAAFGGANDNASGPPVPARDKAISDADQALLDWYVAARREEDKP